MRIKRSTVVGLTSLLGLFGTVFFGFMAYVFSNIHIASLGFILASLSTLFVCIVNFFRYRRYDSIEKTHPK